MRRSSLFIGLFLILFLLFAAQLINLQVFQTGNYNQLADENAARITPLSAPRGIIYDRNGKVVLKNRPVFSLYVLPHYIKKGDMDATFEKLAKLINRSKTEIERSYQKNRSPFFEGVLIESDLPDRLVSRFEEQKDKLRGVEVVCQPMRAYPYKGAAAHVLGYIGEIEPKELDLMEGSGYRIGDIVGKDGVEKAYDLYLRGTSGGKKIEVDAFGRPIRLIETLEPVSGYDMKLTLDMDLQLVVEKALEGKEGAVVVMNPRTGEILAMASQPAYDPYAIEKQISGKKFPFMNRALAHYPPGSTFKVITLSAALQRGMSEPSEYFTCNGYYKLGRRYAKCWREWGHGRISLLEGLVWSCDIVFYQLGKRLGPDIIHDYSKRFGLGEKSGIDLPQEKKGFIPTSAWKKKVLKEDWYDGDSINIGIGQGFIQVTPLQMAEVYAAIATGKRMRPYVVAEIRDHDDKVVYTAEQTKIGGLPISPENHDRIKQALEEVVLRGTGVAAYVPGLPAAGKTGTAQNPGLPHAWFICYAPTDDPELVISTFVAHGEHGDRVTARIAGEILRWYKANRFQRKMPEIERPPQYILHGKYKEWYSPVRKKEGTESD